jgi:glycosyltransferase involved in cell wall biosynthesis
MQISIVIPLFNEDESLPALSSWIEQVMTDNNFSYEVLFIDDGSKDNSWQVIQTLASTNPNIKGIKFTRNYGKSAALYVGFEQAVGDVVITLDADLQDSPEEIPALYQMIIQDGFDLVSGWKQKRYDNTFTKNLPSKLYNTTNRIITGIQLHDMNCGLKAYKNEVIKSIEVYGEMHRFIPVLAKNAGFTNIGEKVVQHQARKFGVSKFGWERFINGFLDLLSVTFMTRFAKKPMHLFGSLGVISFIIGFGILTYLTMDKVFFKEFGIATKPSFYFGIMMLIIGTMLFLTGFLAELVSRNSADRNQYLISKKIGLD